MGAKKLILLTSNFPYGNGETFLETEIVFLANAFDEVVILANDESSKEQRKVPENCSVERVSFNLSGMQRVFALFYIFHPLFRKEITIIKKVYHQKLSIGILKTLLVSLYTGKKIKSHLSALVEADRGNSDLFFYSYWTNDNSIGLAFLKKQHTKIRCFSRVHGWDLYFEATKYNYLPLRDFIAENLDAIFSISTAGLNYCRGRWKIELPEKIKLSRLGVKEQLMLSPSTDRFVLLSCSNVIPLKRLNLIVEALAIITEVKIEWYHIGNGAELKALEEIASDQLKKGCTAHFLGAKSNEEVLNWYKKNKPNLFINVSASEGVPVSIMEAMSFATPVIATNVGGNGEIVNNENGILLSANPSAEEIANAILVFTQYSQQVYEMKRFAAYETWNEKFNAKSNYEKFVHQVVEL